MPHPDFYPEGTVPRIKDTAYRTWVKILSEYQNSPGALSGNNPRRGESLRRIKVKVNKAVHGTI